MAHAKCPPCRARVWRDGPATEEILCPGCGNPMQPVGALSELVGLRCLEARPRTAHKSSDLRFERISEQIRETIARHDAERRSKSDAERS